MPDVKDDFNLDWLNGSGAPKPSTEPEEQTPSQYLQSLLMETMRDKTPPSEKSLQIQAITAKALIELLRRTE